MPAKSKKQQKLMGMALAVKRGEAKPASSEVAKVSASMSAKQLKDFASTKRKGLPVRVKKKK